MSTHTTSHRRIAALGAVAALLGAAAPMAQAHAPVPLKQELRGVIDAGVPGATLLVRHDGRTKIISAGDASLKPKVPMGKTLRRFRIASITKPMVAAVVLQLSAERKLSLDDPIVDYVGNLAGGDTRITIRDLLQHKSGLPEYTEDPRPFAPYLAGHFNHVWTHRQLVGFAVDHKPLFAPGTKISYSNTNYVLLGMIIEKVTGSSLATELRTRVFEPLHMDDTSVAIRSRIRGPHVKGYLVGQGGAPLDVTGVNPSVYWGAGNVTSTVTDLADFMDGLLEGRLLAPTQLAEMEHFEPMFPDTDYGLGLSRGSFPCGTGIGHDGAVAGYLSTAIRMNNGRTVVLMANSLTLNDSVGTKQAEARLKHLFKRAACGS